MSTDQTNEAAMKELVGDIFHLTGQKVEVTDPIVVAALIHSQLIRRAGDDAANVIHFAVQKAKAELELAVKAEREAASDISRATAQAYQDIVTAARAATEAEVPKLQVRFVNLAQDVLQQVRKEASATAPIGWKVKVAFGAAGLVLLGALAGGVIGSAWSGKGRASETGVNPDQAKQLEAGRDFLQVLPQLDEATKTKLIHMIQKNRQ